MTISPAIFSSARTEWETPPELFARLDAEFHFNLDVCATEENKKCERYFSKKDDAFTMIWALHICWMNPPYKRGQLKRWIQRAYLESLQGATVVCLVPSRTDAAWWHDYAMKGEVRFLRGRVHFVGAKSGAPFPSAIIVFRPYGDLLQ